MVTAATAEETLIVRYPIHRAIIAALAILTGVACGSSSGSSGPTTTLTAASSASPGCSSTSPQLTSGSYRVRSNGEDRTYDLTVPTQQSDAPIPLVVNLHGATGTSAGQDSRSGLPQLAATEDFVVLSPQAVEPGRFWRLRADSPDPAFVLGLVDDVASGTCVDLSRVYVAGFSLGGMFAMKLACLVPDRIAAIGVVAGLIDIPCDRDRPVPMIAFQGTDDPTVHLDGTYETGIQAVLQGASRPRPEIAASWAAANGCAAEPDVVDDPRVTTTTYRCPVGSEVELVLTKGGTHQWPRLTADPPADGGPGDNAVDATQLMWDFFEGAQR